MPVVEDRSTRKNPKEILLIDSTQEFPDLTNQSKNTQQHTMTHNGKQQNTMTSNIFQEKLPEMESKTQLRLKEIKNTKQPQAYAFSETVRHIQITSCNLSTKDYKKSANHLQENPGREGCHLRLDERNSESSIPCSTSTASKHQISNNTKKSIKIEHASLF